MRNLKCKLNNQKGETLIEVIASILVCVISISMLMGGVAASATINENADAVNDKKEIWNEAGDVLAEKLFDKIVEMKFV